jgi:flagellar hook protein FlgE
MSLFGSLYSGVSGLGAQSRAMSMISDNVANVNTTAYKGAMAQFSNLVTGSNSSQSYSPGGVRSIAKLTIANQGLIQNSNSPTDAAISGAGFFVVNSLPDGTGEQVYTRAGSFSPDFLGNLRTPSGQFLQGWQLDANENIVDVNNVETVNVGIVAGLATATNEVRIGANLSADQLDHVGAYAVGDLADGTVEPHFSRNVQVYDSLGRPQTMTMGFLKTAANTWQSEIYAADPTVVTAGAVPLASGTVTFNGDGSLATNAFDGLAVTIDWAAATGADDSTITFDLGTIGETGGLTQFASPTNVVFVQQNGAEVGELNGVSINDEGYVVASFTNGQERKLYQLPLATFANPAGLGPRSGNVFAQTDQSGEFNLRVAGRGGAGVLAPSALEAANVDLAEEFTKMIVTQRAYSANSRVITTTNSMLEELIQISR